MQHSSDLSPEDLMSLIKKLPKAQIKELKSSIEELLETRPPAQKHIREWIFSDEILLDDFQLVENEKRFNL